MDAKYEVLVGNIGYVLRTDDFEQAIKTYKEYVAQSELNYGRAGGEDVILWENGEPIKEHFGTLNRDEDEFAKGGEIAEIEKAKQTLIRKAKSKGIYENFGQKEVRQLQDKYGYTSAISEFDNWASHFDLSQMGEGGGISTKKLNWRLGLGHPKYYYGFNNGIIYATEENNITSNLQIKDIELVFPIKSENFIGEKHRTEFISEMVNIFPELTNLEIAEAIHYGGSMATGGGIKRDPLEYADPKYFDIDFTFAERNKLAEEKIREAWQDWGGERTNNLAKSRYRWWGSEIPKSADKFLERLRLHGKPMGEENYFVRDLSEYYFYDSYSKGGIIESIGNFLTQKISPKDIFNL